MHCTVQNNVLDDLIGELMNTDLDTELVETVYMWYRIILYTVLHVNYFYPPLL